MNLGLIVLDFEIVVMEGVMDFMADFSTLDSTSDDRTPSLDVGLSILMSCLIDVNSSLPELSCS